MSKLLKEKWSRLAFGNRNTSINESAAYQVAEDLYWKNAASGDYRNYEASIKTLTSKFSKADLLAAAQQATMSGIKALLDDAVAEAT